MAEQRAKAPLMLVSLRQHLPAQVLKEAEELLSSWYGCECVRHLLDREQKSGTCSRSGQRQKVRKLKTLLILVSGGQRKNWRGYPDATSSVGIAWTNSRGISHSEPFGADMVEKVPGAMANAEPAANPGLLTKLQPAINSPT